MMYQNFRLLGDSGIEHIRGSVTPILENWFSKWFQADENLIEVEVFTSNDQVVDLNQAKRFALTGSDNKWCIIDCHIKIRESILLRWNEKFGIDLHADSENNDCLITEVADMAIEELAQLALTGNIDTQQSNLVREDAGSILPDQAKGINYGGVVLRIHDDDFDINIILSASSVDDYIKYMPDNNLDVKDNIVLPLSSALHNQYIEAEAMLGSASLTIDELMSLKPGDVIKLDRNIFENIVLDIKKTDYSYVGALGKSEGRLAIQITNNTANK